VISRLILGAGLVVLMVVSSVGSYMYLGSRQSNLAAAPKEPTTASPTPGAFHLPGTLFLAQGGAIYSLSAGRFHQITAAAGWTQLANYPGDNLLAVKRSLLFSDVYVLNRLGKVLRKVTNNNVPASNPDPSARHWAFYPRLSYNNKTLFMSYDKPKFGFDVPMSIWAMPVGGSLSHARVWTVSIDYTGGDMAPQPLPSGGIIYTKYLYNNAKIVSEIWLSPQPERNYGCYPLCIAPPPGQAGIGRALTTPAEDCSQPSLSPDHHTMAMICSHQTQTSYLTLATFNGSKLGPRRYVITSQLVAQPTWAPDSSGLAYLAPAQLGQGFQLWFLPKLAYAPPTPSPVPVQVPTPGGPVNSPGPSPSPAPAPPPIVVHPVQVTTSLDFDATSPLAWIP
jgi:hypothetical protein